MQEQDFKFAATWGSKGKRLMKRVKIQSPLSASVLKPHESEALPTPDLYEERGLKEEEEAVRPIGIELVKVPIQTEINGEILKPNLASTIRRRQFSTSGGASDPGRMHNSILRSQILALKFLFKYIDKGEKVLSSTDECVCAILGSASWSDALTLCGFLASSKCANNEIDVLAVWDSVWEVLCADILAGERILHCDPGLSMTDDEIKAAGFTRMRKIMRGRGIVCFEDRPHHIPLSKFEQWIATVGLSKIRAISIDDYDSDEDHDVP